MMMMMMMMMMMIIIIIIIIIIIGSCLIFPDLLDTKLMNTDVSIITSIHR